MDNWEISRILGNLQKGQEESERSRDRLFNLLTSQFDKIDVQLETLPMLKQTVEEIAPMARDWKATKNKAIGALAVTGIGGFLGGAGLMTALKSAFAIVAGK